MMCTRRSLFGACVLALAGAGLTPGSASAQPASGFYLSQEIGLNVAPAVALLGNSTDRASRCDEFINPRFAEVPGCTDPNRGSGAGWKTTYNRAAGILAGLSAGYRFGGRLRVEAEWFHRESAYDQTAPVTSATGDTFAKLDGEIQRAEDRIGSLSSQNVFANAYVDFPGRSRVTPYVGAGVGIGLTALDYGDLWARNPNPAAIGTAAGLPNEAEIRRNLAATTTSKQAELHDRLTGYQVLGGVDYAMSDAVSLGIKGRCGPPTWTPPTGAPNTPSVPPSSIARFVAGIARPAARGPNRSSRVWSAPRVNATSTSTTSSPRCCGHRVRWSPRLSTPRRSSITR